MPSRNVLTPLNPKIPPSAEDLNIIYNLLNGFFDNRKGHGMSVQLTAYDGRLASGALNTTKYALEVRNRETTQQRTAAFRRADNKIVAAIEGGLLYAVKDTSSLTSPTQVIVHGTTAGGVLGGTYPDPTFALATEYYRIYPTMIMAWYGSASTTSRSDGYSGTNLEVTDCPGWVFCTGQTVKLRSGTSMSAPNMIDRLPIGPGTVTYKSTGGGTWSGSGGLSAISIEHTHTHSHPHEHTIGAHSHNYNHSHSATYNHTHSMNGHTHTITHEHSMANHYHQGNTLSWPHAHAHSHDVGDHSHVLQAHDHDSGTYQTASGETTNAASGGAENAGSGGDTATDFSHYHTLDQLDIVGISATGEINGTGTAFTSTEAKTGLSTDERLTTAASPSATGSWTGNTDGPYSAEVGVSNNRTGPTLTASSGGSSADSGTSSPSTFNTDNLGPGNVPTSDSSAYSTTGSTIAADATASSVTTVNVQPPVLAWHWIMKL